MTSSIKGGLSQGCRWAPISQAPAMQFADKLRRLWCAADRVIEDEGRLDMISVKDHLGAILAFHRADTHRTPRPAQLPIKFGFGIDDDDEHRRLLGRPVDHPPRVRIEHSQQQQPSAVREILPSMRITGVLSRIEASTISKSFTR